MTGSQELRPGGGVLSYLVAALFAAPFGAIPGLFAGLAAGPVIGAATVLLAHKPLPRSLAGLIIGAVPRWMLETGTRATVAPGDQSLFEWMGAVTGAVAGLLTATLAAFFLNGGVQDSPAYVVPVDEEVPDAAS